jgi:3-oxoacyl-[acyl-carrier-protein] synthase-1
MMTNLSVTALGAVTSVGYSAATACSSIRAGVTRPSLLDGFEVLDMDEQEPVGLTAHPLGEATRGFSGVGRWLQMAALALEDLSVSGSLPAAEEAWFWSAADCYLVLPVLDPRRFDSTGMGGSEEALEASFLRPLRNRCASFFAPSRTALLARGRIGTLEAIQVAARQVFEGRAARAVVLAVDSLVDEPALLWLAESNRLKEDENPVGLVPGEAAVAFVVEPAPLASERGSSPLAHIVAVATARENNAFMWGGDSLGDAVAEVVQRVVSDAGVATPYRAEVLTDLNGESWRSAEYGNARIKIPTSVWAGDRYSMPAASVGDVGAAMTALELAVACHSLDRGYAAGRNVMVISSDEYGEVGAAVLEREG